MPASSIEVAPGAVHLKRYFSDHEQRTIAARCLEIGAGEAGFYTPVVRGGHPMSVRMLCLGRHWNARTYSYQDRRLDVDGLAAPELPSGLAEIARRAGADAGFAFSPDLCIVNWYSVTSRMGLHQDKDESPDSIARGAPVVSVSIGDAGLFLFGGFRRRDPVEKLILESGDAFVFGGPSRLRYHGIARIEPGTAPPGLPFDGRLNLTFREF
jgi:DNA alkylation damage repair protein AlkB